VVTALEVRDGELVTGPAGRCAVHPQLRVRRYEVRIEGDELVVSL
jgi:nitrite reductase/ring-hydroxylating ferredoxin subunit